MKKLFGALLFALALTGMGHAQSYAPFTGLNITPGDTQFSNNMYTLDKIFAGSRASITPATPVSIVATTLTTTGLVLPSVPASTTVHAHCSIIWEQLTAAATVTFGIGNSSAPTGLYVMNVASSGAAGATTAQLYTVNTNTTPVNISTATTPGAAATGYKDEIDFVLVNAATAADVVTIYGLTSNASDALAIEPGSWCSYLP